MLAAASSVATAEKAAKEEVAEETAKQPTKPARRSFFDRIPGMRSGALWAHLLFILVALYAFDYVTHAAADDIYVYRLGAISLADYRTVTSCTPSARAVCRSPTRRLRRCSLPARVPHRAAEHAADYRHYLCAQLLVRVPAVLLRP